MISINTLLNKLNEIAPFDTAEEWDNVGLLVGDRTAEVKKVLLTLDITENLIDEAIKSNCNTIIAHHPMIFVAQKSITTDTQLGKNLIKAIKNNINIIAFHTNYDKAAKGTNYWLANKLNLQYIRQIRTDDCEYIFVGEKAFKNIDILKNYISEKLHMPLELIKVYGKEPNSIKRISVLGGSGVEFMQDAKNVSDLMITADVKHHDGQKAFENDFLIIDATHHYSEIHGIEGLKVLLEKEFADLEIEIYNKLEYMIIK